MIKFIGGEADTAFACDMCREPIMSPPASVWWVLYYEEHGTEQQRGPWLSHGSSMSGGPSRCHRAAWRHAEDIAAEVGGSVLDADLTEFLRETTANYGIKSRPAQPGTREIERCYLCLEMLTPPIEMDHVLPKSRGVQDSLLMPVHKMCNRIKGNRPLIRR